MKTINLIISILSFVIIDCSAQEFIFNEPPQYIVNLGIGRADSFLIKTSTDPNVIGKYFKGDDLHFNINEFRSLFNDTNQIAISSFSIFDKNRKCIFSYMLPLINFARIVKISQTDYAIYEAFAFNFEKGFDSIKIDESLKYNMKICENDINIVMDTTFYKTKFKINLNIDNLIAEYNSYKNQETFITKDWGKVSEESVNRLGKLAYKLTLASINGSNECLSILMNFRKTFDIMNYGSLSEGLGHYEFLLKKIKNEL